MLSQLAEFRTQDWKPWVLVTSSTKDQQADKVVHGACKIHRDFNVKVPVKSIPKGGRVPWQSDELILQSPMI